jgi:hypothetical protein
MGVELSNPYCGLMSSLLAEAGKSGAVGHIFTKFFWFRSEDAERRGLNFRSGNRGEELVGDVEGADFLLGVEGWGTRFIWVSVLRRGLCRVLLF